MQTDTALSILMSQGFSKTVLERFWDKVDKNGQIHPHQPELGQCWNWLGGLNHDEYANLFKSYSDHHKAMAHRVSWIIHNGAIPEGMMVLHSCDFRQCTNPKHLFLGTQLENMIDRTKKGRQPHKLSDDDVREIHRIGKSLFQYEIAKKFGVQQNMISRILSRVRRRHVVL